MKKKVELEHILSQHPSHEAIEEFGAGDDWTDYVQRLGNLTLLEKVPNASLQNKPYSEKKQVYLNSRFLLTKSIPAKLGVGKDTKIDRLAKRLRYFEEWNPDAIAQRRAMLQGLSYDVWEMPKP